MSSAGGHALLSCRLHLPHAGVALPSGDVAPTANGDPSTALRVVPSVVEGRVTRRASVRNPSGRPLRPRINPSNPRRLLTPAAKTRPDQFAPLEPQAAGR